MSRTEDEAAAFFAEVVVALKTASDGHGVSFFDREPDPPAESYWVAPRSRSSDFITTIPADGGPALLRELGLMWARDRDVLLARQIVPVTDLYRTTISDDSGKRIDDAAEVSDFVYPLF
ncbi:MAG: hypothetical protein AAF441_21130 [Pseudomonadota bacterium]